MRRFHVRRHSDRLHGAITAAAGAAAVVLLAACAPSGSTGTGPDGADDDTISVVTSINVYGDIARSVGGDAVQVTALVDSLSQDPHSYEATVRDKLAVSEADIVIENGGGYDVFLDQLVEDTEVQPAEVISAVEISGLGDEHAGHGDDHAGHNHGAFNEHVWYSLPAMSTLADELAAKFSELDPGSAATFEANADQFTAELSELEHRLDTLAAEHGGTEVAITEPVPLYLLESAGLVNATPAAFSEAVEEGTGVPAAVLQDTLQLLTSGQVGLLAYNEQTEGSQTLAVKAAAEEAGIPVVDFTETLPPDNRYPGWMGANIEQLEQAVAGQ